MLMRMLAVCKLWNPAATIAEPADETRHPPVLRGYQNPGATPGAGYGSAVVP